MKDIADFLTGELGSGLKTNVPLRDHVSIKVGGVADYFYVAKDVESLTKATLAAFKAEIPYFILAGGYNIIPSDAGFPGLVILNKSSNITFSPESSTVIVDSGVHLGTLINLAAGRDLGGLEFLFGVPGTIGGAIYGNAGAFGYEIGDFAKAVTLLIPKNDDLVIVKHGSEWMDFSYRSSKLKKMHFQKFPPVILTATLQLVQRRKDEILRMMRDNIAAKKKNQPLDEVSAGSFFKNPGREKDMTAGYLLEKSGAKKFKVGGAAFSNKHGNFLVNRKKASALDVKNLADKAKEQVKSKFNIDLEEEAEYIGRW